MARLLLWLSSLFLFFQLVSSHLIEIPASKKECFFEDLHEHDQVLHAHLFTSVSRDLLIVPDDRHVPGWRGRPLGHRFLGKVASLLPYVTALTQVTDQRSRRRRNSEEHQVLNRDRVHHRD
jgi:hypothetical protein